MFCKNCGAQIDDNSRFCPECGERSENSVMGAGAPDGTAKPFIPTDGQRVTENIYLCPDGVYRWVYEFHMMKNPTIFFSILKAFGGALAGIFVFDMILLLADGDLNVENVLDNGKNFLLIFLVLGVITFISYVIVAARYGWKYIVLFEMDGNGVTHTQMQKQFEKAQATGWLLALAGLAVGNPTLAGAGINSAVHNTISSDFSKVKNIKVLRHRGVIKVNEMLYKNQVYAEKADFDFVLGFIREHLPAGTPGSK